MFHIVPPGTKIDFVAKRKFFLPLSVLALIGTVFLFFTKGLNYGIDFTGGAEITVKVPVAWDIGQLRKELTKGGLKNPRVQNIGEPEGGTAYYMIRAQGSEKDLKAISGQVRDVLEKGFPQGGFELSQADVVGPAAGAILRQKGLLAMFYALLVILIYVAIRFDSRYAPGAIVALLHDSFIVMGVFMVTGKQFDLTILAALLALIGYSNNDTIIVYDRVRETLYMNPSLSIEKAVNKAMNETLGRTILTSISTFLVVASLFFLGGAVIHNFAFTLMCGVIVGTYSSVFIASSAIISITHFQKNREAKLRNKPRKKRRQFDVRPDPSAST